ncbi:hypothetical protein VHEMI10147 [[Torrubiella] hemipterigena]|uniref:Dipeptidyl-peptidase V n=1 Tax=[Torrubiella] hemipterigena TaxID=1531966 RepID=A0A0A1TSU4_9HYPO|nr:hypothetical protein VHEMI10147 [[Torrubiella] hemipterigena]
MADSEIVKDVVVTPGVFDEDLAEELYNLDSPVNFRFSPKCDRLVYQSGLTFIGAKEKQKGTIWLAATDQAGSARQLTTGLFNDSNPEWHPDGDHIIFLSDRASPGDAQSIWMMPLTGGDARPVSSTEARNSVQSFKVSPDGKTIAFLSNDEISKEKKEQEEKDGALPQVWGEDWIYRRLRILDIESGKVRTLSEEKRHVYEMDWHPDGKSIAYSSAANTEEPEPVLSGARLSVVDVDSGAIRHVYNVLAEVYDLTYMTDGKLYFIAPYEIHLIKGNSGAHSVDTLAAEPTLNRAALGETDSPVQILKEGDKVYIRRQNRIQDEVCDIDGNVMFANGESFKQWSVGIDPESQQPMFALGLSTPDKPCEAYVVRSGKDTIQLSNFGKAVKDKVNATTHIFTCRSLDNEEDIEGIFIVPTASIGSDSDSKPAKPLPTVVMPHGGPTYRDSLNFDPSRFSWTPYLLNKGYGILLIQYRGSTGYGQRFAAWSGRGIGTFDYEDVISVTDHAIKQGLADPKRMVVGYWSQGGYLAYLCAVRNGLHNLGWKFNAVIAGAGFCDIDSLMLGSDCGPTDQVELAGFKGPWKIDRDDTTARKASAIWEMKHAVEEAKRRGEMVIPPVLILHGELDNRCPYWQAVAFQRALRCYGLPCEFVTYPGQGHMLMPRSHQMDALKRVARLCDAYAGPGFKIGGEP